MKGQKTIKKVLLTQGRLNNYAGSEIATLEMAEYFESIGAEVVVLTHYYGGVMQHEFNQLSNTTVIRSTTSEAEQLQMSDYDLVWVQHNTLMPKMVDDLGDIPVSSRPLVIYAHLSSMEPLEYPTMIDAEMEIGDLFAFNSPETKDNITQSAFSFPEEKTFVFGNAAPDSFFRQTNSSDELGQIAVVSNHPPEEVVLAATALEEKGVEVDFIGKAEQGKQTRVTAELLEKYDAVVTIGKTVQYCIAMQKPVYVYDRFGGAGYLSSDNFEKNRLRNFSGRGYDKKSHEQVAEELASRYQKAKTSIQQIHEKYAEEFRYSRAMDEIIDMASINTNTRSAVSEKNRMVYKKYLELIKDLLPIHSRYIYQMRDIESSYSACRKNVGKLQKIIDEQNEKIKQQEALLSVRLERSMRKAAKKFKNQIKGTE